MLIIAEGAEKTGKTTILEKVNKRLVTKGYDCVINAQNLIPTDIEIDKRIGAEDLITTLIKFLLDSKKVYLCDTSPIKDIVDRVIDSKSSVLSIDNLMTIFGRSPIPPAIIYCKNDKNVELKSNIYDLVMNAIRYSTSTDKGENYTMVIYNKFEEDYDNLICDAIETYCEAAVETLEEISKIDNEEIEE